MNNITVFQDLKINLKNYLDIKNYDIILSDTELENIDYENIQGESITEALSYYTQEEKYKKIFIIIEYNSLESIFALVTKHPDITILEIHTGIYAQGKKSYTPTLSPYSLREYGFEIYEPIDQKNIKKILSNTNTKNHKKYIAINDVYFPEELSKGETLPIAIQYTPEQKNTTLILSIGHPYIQVGQALQIANINSVTLLISDTITLNKKAISHIKEAQNLIIIIDNNNPNIINKNIQAQLYDNKIFNKEILIITPNYEKLNTVLTEYQLQEAEFNAEGILKQLQLI